jgi:AcrR family transcriptional regulator
MEHKKMDRRVGRTRRMLRDAMMALILERGYDSVTIEDITNRADVGRTTFYLHYRDKEELLLESINDIIEDLKEQIAHIPLSAWSFSDGVSPSPIQMIFQHGAEHVDLYRVMLRGEGISKSHGQIRTLISNAAIELFRVRMEKENLSIQPVVALDFFVNYFAGAIMGILMWWLENNMPYPPKVMAEMFQKMFIPGAIEVMGVTVE